jgi:hypothetical protein
VDHIAGTSTTTFTLIFLGLMFLGGCFLWFVIMDKPVKQKLSNAAATQYGEDFNDIAWIVARDMVPKFPHLPIDQLTELVITAIANRTKTDVKLYAFTVRQICEKLRAQAAGTPMDEAPGPVNRWTD